MALPEKNGQLPVVSVKIYDIFGPDKLAKTGGVSKCRRAELMRYKYKNLRPSWQVLHLTASYTAL